MPEMIDNPSGISAEEFPLPMGVDEETGRILPGFAEPDLDRIDGDPSDVSERGERGAADHLAIADIDPNNLAEAGWCVVYAAGVAQAVKDALQPLLKHRESQAGRLFRVFDGSSAIQPDEQAKAWVERHEAGFSVVDPENGVPLYVLLVGSPVQIPFEFQYLLDLYWSVGRLDFDTPEEYERYARTVVDYETSASVPTRKKAAFFTVKNDGDRATGLLHNQVIVPIVNGAPKIRTLQGFKGFHVQPLLAENATKERLASLLAGNEPGGLPAFLFTGSHGIRAKLTDPKLRDKQGAILCQDWPGFGAVQPDHLFTADDIPAGAQLNGLIHFFFACYGGGCPANDNFEVTPGGKPKPLMPEPVVARLPQRMLNHGALASFAHVDRAWAYSFQNSRSAPQVQEMRDVMVRIFQGQRLGQAIDGFNMRWAVLSADLQEAQALRASIPTAVSAASLANRWVARNDARNYIVIGDPAVQLRTGVMAGMEP
jgi:hypothetical protein